MDKANSKARSIIGLCVATSAGSGDMETLIATAIREAESAARADERAKCAELARDCYNDHTIPEPYRTAAEQIARAIEAQK